MNGIYTSLNKMSLAIVTNDLVIDVSSTEELFDVLGIQGDSDVTIIAYKSIVIKKIIAQTNILIICSSIFFDNAVINLSCLKQRNNRKKNPIPHKMYGLPGFPGYPGYNLAIYCNNVTANDITSIASKLKFKSTGGRGGKGQNGTPKGRHGEGGSPGHLIINKMSVSIGQQGPDINDEDDVNITGSQHPEENMFGFIVNTSEYRQIIYKGIHENYITSVDSKFLSLFDM